ncbi:hypothetical protein C8A01DRAFT_39201 [Parachaetomium inaequale]|uniref:Uncharacterized protein n=1 Tax=Parachaetomium inaequale TaxID=2588326 RepID=A0AAN6PDH0_9PEZI|nr:hypothetical protein C8A01DRAFT_39201 [Parachaetomium inaequale]
MEALPPELRLQILLSISDVADLKAVVHASPVFHQQYLLDRQKVLGRVLEGTLGGAFVEAYAVQASTCLDKPGGELLRPTVEQFLGEYRGFRLDPGAVLRQCTIEDLAGMAAFHQDAIQTLLEYCPAVFLSKFDTTTGTPLQVGDLSTTERTRFLRSLYRFQLFCILFSTKRPYYPPEGFSEEDVLTIFFGIFNPWEAEEVACISRIIETKYQRVFEAIKGDLDRDNPRFSDWDWPTTPPGSFYLNEERHLEVHIQGTMRRGLALFRQVLGTEDHEALVQLMQANIGWQEDPSLTRCLSSYVQSFRRTEAAELSAHDQMEVDSKKLRYSCDRVDAPPLAWVVLWRGEYSNWFGEVIPSSLQDWGHVFWDGRRLHLFGGRNAVVRERWAQDDDPRYTLV